MNSQLTPLRSLRGASAFAAVVLKKALWLACVCVFLPCGHEAIAAGPVQMASELTHSRFMFCKVGGEDVAGILTAGSEFGQSVIESGAEVLGHSGKRGVPPDEQSDGRSEEGNSHRDNGSDDGSIWWNVILPVMTAFWFCWLLPLIASSPNAELSGGTGFSGPSA